jgi:hypothetical protein
MMLILWMRLYRTGREAYLDMEELEENLHLDLDLQRQDFVTDEELDYGRRNSSEAPNSEGAQQATLATPNPRGAKAQVVVETVSEDDDDEDDETAEVPTEAASQEPSAEPAAEPESQAAAESDEDTIRRSIVSKHRRSKRRNKGKAATMYADEFHFVDRAELTDVNLVGADG